MEESIEGEVLTRFEKNSLEEIRFSLLEKRGYHFVDIRVFSSPQRGEKKEPTSYCITLPLSLFSELKGAVLKVEKKLNEKEILGPVGVG